MWALQADTVEYGEWESGVRTEGTNYAALSFTRKVGQGIGGAVAAYGIGLGGYVAGSARADTGRPRHHPLPHRWSERLVHRDRNRDHARLPADGGTVPDDDRRDRGPTQRACHGRGRTPRVAGPPTDPHPAAFRPEDLPCSAPVTPPLGNASRSSGSGGSSSTAQARAGRPGGSAGRCPDARAMAVPASFNDIAADAAVRDYFGDIWYQTHGPGAARLGRPADRPALRVGDAPGDGLGGRDRGRLATRAATRRSRPTSPTTSVRGEEARITVVVNNTLSFQTIPPGVIEDTPDGKRAALLARLLQLRGHPPVGVARTRRRGPTSTTSPSSPASTVRPASVDYTVRGHRRRGTEVRVVLRDADGRRGRDGRGRRRHADRRRRAPLGAR